MCATADMGCEVNVAFENEYDIFSESLSRAIVEVKPQNIQAFNDLAYELGISYIPIGKTGGDILAINSLYRKMDKVKDVYFNRFKEVIEQDL
jgi:phosphoribosylformylglycinamidine synthase